jgi:hypothetical protein
MKRAPIALEGAFYATFSNLEPCNNSVMAGSGITAREAGAAMALVTAATGPQDEIVAFSAPARGCESHFPCYGGMRGGGDPGVTRVNISPQPHHRAL